MWLPGRVPHEARGWRPEEAQLSRDGQRPHSSPIGPASPALVQRHYTKGKRPEQLHTAGSGHLQDQEAQGHRSRCSPPRSAVLECALVSYHTACVHSISLRCLAHYRTKCEQGVSRRTHLSLLKPWATCSIIRGSLTIFYQD